MVETREGGCLCGAVRYEVVLPSKWCAHCHCSMCRRAHGAAYVTWFGMVEAQFRVTAGDVTRFASSDEATRSFCGVCGTSLFFESERWAGEVHVTLASLDGELDLAPQAHAFWQHRAKWTVIGDELPKVGGDSGTEP